MEAPVSASDRFGADAFNDVAGRQSYRFSPKMLNQCARQHNALVCLHGQFGQHTHGLLVVADAEYLEAKCCLQLDQVLAPRLFALPIFILAFCRNLELVGNQFQQRWEGLIVNAQDVTWETQVAELYCEP